MAALKSLSSIAPHCEHCHSRSSMVNSVFFLHQGESTSQQQVFRDLNNTFTRFFKGKSTYPNFKSKKNPKQSFRIQKNGNNIRITNRRIRLAKIGFVHYQTSKEYRKLLKTSKINNVTVKKRKWKILCHN